MYEDHDKRYLQNPDGVGGAGALPPARDDHNVVAGRDEVALLAEVDGVVDSGVHVVNPGAVRAGLLIVQGDAAAEHLGLPRHLGVPAKKQKCLYFIVKIFQLLDWREIIA